MFDCATVSRLSKIYNNFINVVCVYTVYLLFCFNNCDLWDRPKHESTVYCTIVNIKICILDVVIHYASVYK